jgi:hypothetical protein
MIEKENLKVSFPFLFFVGERWDGMGMKYTSFKFKIFLELTNELMFDLLTKS